VVRKAAVSTLLAAGSLQARSESSVALFNDPLTGAVTGSVFFTGAFALTARTRDLTRHQSALAYGCAATVGGVLGTLLSLL
jgi:hypothetical protein